MGHGHIERTSPKGRPFVGTCTACGTRGLTLANMNDECPNQRGVTQDEALIDAISRPRASVEAEAAHFLWSLLDDIDTVSDMAKADDRTYREAVERIQRRRFEVGTTDGYSVTFHRHRKVESA
jgi:hypothetical protein